MVLFVFNSQSVEGTISRPGPFILFIAFSLTVKSTVKRCLYILVLNILNREVGDPLQSERSSGELPGEWWGSSPDSHDATG